MARASDGKAIGSVRQPIALLVLVFIIGLAIGLFFQWGRQQMAGSVTAEEEYAALVATLYEREHLLTNAQERLARAGFQNAAARVSEIASDFPDKHPRRQRAATSLQVLAQALAEAGSWPPSPSPEPQPSDAASLDWITIALIAAVGATLVVGAVLVIRSPRPDRGRGRSPARFSFGAGPNKPGPAKRPAHWRPVNEVTLDERVSEVVSAPRPLTTDAAAEPKPPGAEPAVEPPPLVVEAVSEPRPLTTGAASPACPLVFESVSEPRPLTPIESVSEPRPIAWSPAPEPRLPMEESVSEPYPLAPQKKPWPASSSGHSVSAAASASSPSASALGLGAERRQPTPPAQTTTSALARRIRAGSASSLAAAGKGGGAPVFHCRYHRGDDPYDATHAIYDPSTKVAIGACGISSALVFGETDECYAFTVWLQDYASGDEIASLGLISKWAEGARAQQLRSWAARERLQSLVPAADGLTFMLETSNLRATITLDDVDYYEDDSLPKYASFGHLRISFRVAPKG